MTYKIFNYRNEKLCLISQEGLALIIDKHTSGVVEMDYYESIKTIFIVADNGSFSNSKLLNCEGVDSNTKYPGKTLHMIFL